MAGRKRNPDARVTSTAACATRVARRADACLLLRTMQAVAVAPAPSAGSNAVNRAQVVRPFIILGHTILPGVKVVARSALQAVAANVILLGSTAAKVAGARQGLRYKLAT